MDTNIETIKKLKEKKESIQIARAKISAQLENQEKLRDELVNEVLNEFGITIDDLDVVLEKMITEQNEKIEKAETLLNKVNL